MSNFPFLSIAEANALLTAPGAPFELEDAEIEGVATQIYKHAPQTLRDVFFAGRNWGERTYLVYEDERVSFESHFKAVSRFAHALVDEFGILPGDRVAIAMRNCPQWSVAFHAIMLTGAIAAPLNSWWTSDELERALVDCGARIAVLDAERGVLLKDSRKACPQLQQMIVANETGDEDWDFRLEEFVGLSGEWARIAALAPPELPMAADDPVAIMYTSGTGGRAKGVVATHRNIVSAIWNTAACKARSFLRSGQRPPEPSVDAPQQASLMSTPLFHATACFTGLIPAHLSGAKLVFQRKFDAGEALKLIEEEGVTHLGGVPTIVWRLIEHPDLVKHDLSKVQMVAYGGAPSSPDLVERISELFPQAAPGNGWGMTETCSTVTLNFGEDYILRPASAGAPAPSTRVRVVDDDGRALPCGVIGELEASGPNVARGYWNDEYASTAMFHDGWVRTGDLAHIDEEGFVFLVDRKKDIIIRGGENIYTLEIEAALCAHPDIVEAGVVGLAHAALGEVVGAVVQLRADVHPAAALEDEIRCHVGLKLAAFKSPAKMLFSHSPLPRNANGKILKQVLRAMFEESDDAQGRRQEYATIFSTGTASRAG